MPVAPLHLYCPTNHTPHPQSASPLMAALSLAPANIVQGHYRYIDDLLQLSTTSSPAPSQDWLTYHSPIKLGELPRVLASHPDQAFAAFIKEGLAHGFRVGYSHDRSQLRSRSSNHPSASANRQVMDERIEKARVQCRETTRSDLNPTDGTHPHQPTSFDKAQN